MKMEIYLSPLPRPVQRYLPRGQVAPRVVRVTPSPAESTSLYWFLYGFGTELNTMERCLGTKWATTFLTAEQWLFWFRTCF